MTDGAVKKYYALAGQTVATRDGNGLQYFLTDHLGSVLAVTDASGTLISEQRYLPFGEVRTDVGEITQTDFGYTFQRGLPGTGLMDYRARFYAPALGRFHQPDSIVPGVGNPQSLNRYSYVGNDPITHIDPSGHWHSDYRDRMNRLRKAYGDKIWFQYRRAYHRRGYSALPVFSNGVNNSGGDDGGESGDPGNVQSESPGTGCQGPNPSIICLPENNSVLPELPRIPTVFLNPTNPNGLWYEKWPPDGYYVAGYENYINWFKVDKVDLTIDIAGIVADVGYLTIGTPAAPISVPVTLIAQGVEWVGIGEAILDIVERNDLSDLTSIGFQNAMEIVVASKAPGAVPLVGIGFSIGGLASNILNAIDTRPVLRPFPIITSP